MALWSTCLESSNKEECRQGSAWARFYPWKVLLLRTRRIFLWTVVLPFCIHGTIATQTWKKTIFFTPARFEQKLFYMRKCVTCDRSEFATKQRKMCLTTNMSKIRLPHIYKCNNYVIMIKINPLLTAILKNLQNKSSKVLL